LQRFDGVGFTLWQYPGNHLINTGLAGNGVCRCRVIPGQHHQAIARTVQAFQGIHAVLAQRIANGNQSRRFAVYSQQYRCRALRCLRFQFTVQC
jgi:hypothetical protein